MATSSMSSRRTEARTGTGLLASCALVAAGPGCAQPTVTAQAVACPPVIATRQELREPVPAWTASQLGGTSRLLYAEIYDGPPRNEQALMPDQQKAESGREVLIWRLRGAPAKDGTWLVCAYQNTQVRLELRLPDGVTECSQTNSTDPRRAIKLLAQGCH